jgi:hypothetical protein
MFTFLPSLGKVPKDEGESCYAARAAKGRRREILLGMLTEKRSGGDSWNNKESELWSKKLQKYQQQFKL